MRHKRHREVFDQYGEVCQSQDCEESYYPTGSRSFQGGGTGGMGRPSRGRNTDLTYERKIPKFLQAYQHCLTNKPKNDIEAKRPKVENDKDDDEDDDETRQEAILRAIEENPSFEKDVDPNLLRKAKANREKEKGNFAFSKEKYEDAIIHFTRCIEFDPLNEVFYSNRAAAYLKQCNYNEALADATIVIQKKPEWVKGWARQAASYFGLTDYVKARDAYRRAIEIDPNSQILESGYEKAEVLARKQLKDNKHIFNLKQPNFKSRSNSKNKSNQKPSIQLFFDDNDEDK